MKNAPLANQSMFARTAMRMMSLTSEDIFLSGFL